MNTTTAGGKLIYHLFSAFAEFQREVIVENTIAGMQAAKKRGSPIGRPRLLRPEVVVEAHKHIMQRGDSLEVMAQRLGVCRMTLDRAIKRLDLDIAA